MFTETLKSTSNKEKNMESEYSTEESGDDDDDDDNETNEFPPLPSDIDLVSYANTTDPYDNSHHTVDLFYCPSPPLPPPAPPIETIPTAKISAITTPSSSVTMGRIYANARTISSIRNFDSENQPAKLFATQHKKKNRAPVAGLLQGIYMNMPATPSLPRKSVLPTNEVTYATLMNTTSIAPSLSSDLSTSHVEYQEIHVNKGTNKKTRSRTYENVKSRRPPPPPCYASTNIFERTSSAASSTNSSQVDQSLSNSEIINENLLSSPAARIYINLKSDYDRPPIIPTRTNKQVSVTMQKALPPIIPPRRERKESSRRSSSNMTGSVTEKEEDDVDMNTVETSSTSSSVQTVKQIEINMTPNCDDKSELYRTKMSIPTADNIPSFLNARQRRLLHSTRRRRLRGSLAFRSSIGLRGSTRGSNTNNNNINRPQYPRSNSNIAVRHPMITDDRWRRTIRKRRRQRVVQMKLDGNASYQASKSTKHLSDHTYNEIKQPVLLNTRLRTNIQNAATGGVIERAMHFNGALRDRVFSWYRGANHNSRETQQPQSRQQQQKQQLQQTISEATVTTITPKVFSTSENMESDQKGTTTNEDEEEEFFTHDTFEDFLLRRRPKSAASTTISGTSTVVSEPESIPHRLPVRKSSNQKSKISAPPPPPPPPPPLPPTPPPARRFPGLALGLDKTDVDFIHNILQRTRGEHRVWNRITALKEAYIRATSKKNDQPKKPKPNVNQIDEKKKKKAALMKHSLAATKVRAELEKYDELPASSVTNHDEYDYYDESCAMNPHLKMSRSMALMPQTPSAAHRILNFVVSMKRRAQSNVQQLQKNLQDIRSRVHIEAKAMPPTHISMNPHTSVTSRQRQMLKDGSNTLGTHHSRVETALNQNTTVRRTNSHRSTTSTEHSMAIHRHHLNRTQSNVSQLMQQRNTQHRHRRPRLSLEKNVGAVDRSPSVTTRPPPTERHPSRQAQNGITIRRQRSKNPC